MKMNLKVLGIGAVLLLSFTILAFGNENTQISKTNSFKKPKTEFKQITNEQRIEKYEKSIQNLEKKYEEGLISQETYEEKKANFNEIIEKLKNGEYKIETGKVTIERAIEKLEKLLQLLEKDYESGKISKEVYDKQKAYITKQIEKAKNGENPFQVKRLPLTKEEIQEKLKYLEEYYKKGKISKEKYEEKKASYIERIENLNM